MNPRSVTDGGQLKLERAREHIADAQHAAEGWLTSGAFTIDNRLDLASGRTEARVKLSEPPPARLALIVGDVVHNLRAALDHAIFDCAYRGAGGSLNEKEERLLAFPVLNTAPPEGFETRTAAQLGHVPADIRRVIEESQPFRRNSPDSPDGFRFHPLSQLHDLDIIDKHRRLTVTAASLGHHAVGIPDGVEPDTKFSHHSGPVEDGQLLVSYLGAEAGVEYHFDLRVVITEDRVGVRARPVDALLDALLRHVEWLLWRIRAPHRGAPEPSAS